MNPLSAKEARKVADAVIRERQEDMQDELDTKLDAIFDKILAASREGCYSTRFFVHASENPEYWTFSKITALGEGLVKSLRECGYSAYHEPCTTYLRLEIGISWDE